jgi:cellulose 1,4-beta-cellobiosidase
MKPPALQNVLSERFSIVVGVVLLAELAACARNPSVDGGAVVEAGSWPPGVTVNTCAQYATVPVGAYVVESDYWNKESCPGSQCMAINNATGAFSVTQAPNCDNTVASYPNVLYGCSFGTCSPASLLPMPVSALSTVTSSWDFSVGGVTADQYDVAYDIWFCPNNTCGPSGFPGGTELMIWLNYQNVSGWENDLGSVSLDGHTWEVWQFTQGTGGNSWTYLAYMIQSPMLTSVTNLDLNAFFQDAASRGYLQDSWYLYAIQAGNEIRTGGLPYNNNSFSVSINGVTPVVPDAGAGAATSASCDGGIPTAEGGLVVSDNYVTAGSLHGYAAAWTWVGSDSSAIACAAPTCTAPDSLQVTAILQNGVAPLTAEAVSCSPAFAPSALCTAGTVMADPTYESVAGLGFNFSQDTESDGGADAGSLGTIIIDQSITITVEKSGSAAGNSALRVQLTDSDNNFYCYNGQWTSGVAIPITQFNTRCWDNSGTFATSSLAFKRVDILVPCSATTDEPFAYCLTNVSVE